MTDDCVNVSSLRKSKEVFILPSQYNFAMQESQTFHHSWRRQSYVTNYKTKNKNHICVSYKFTIRKIRRQIILRYRHVKNISRWFVVLFDNVHHRRTWKELTSDFIRKQGERSRYVYHQWFSKWFPRVISGFIGRRFSNLGIYHQVIELFHV